jgi:SMODS and SLOG-associating 2TM effector domain family 4
LAQASLHPEHVALESQVRECFGRCAYSHKTHERMADHQTTKLTRAKWFQIALSALIAGGAVGLVFNKGSDGFVYGTAALSILNLAFGLYMKNIDPGKLAQQHRETAADIWNVRESYLSLLTDIRDSNIALADLRDRRDDLQAKLYRIYHAAPRTNAKAYQEAQDRLQNKEDLTFTDKEIDAFLPATLRRSNEDGMN